MKLVIFLLLFNNSLAYLLNNKIMMNSDNIKNSKHQIIGKKFNRLSPEVEAKTILSQNNAYGILSTLNRKKSIKDYPYGSLVGFSLDKNDKPFFIFSDLAIHTRNILINNKVSLYVNEYGFKTPTDSRVTLTGDLILIKENEDYYKNIYLENHPGADWINFPDFHVYLMKDIKDISFVGGFGSAIKIKINDYNSVDPDPIIFKIDTYINYVNKNFNELFFEILTKFLRHDIKILHKKYRF